MDKRVYARVDARIKISHSTVTRRAFFFLPTTLVAANRHQPVPSIYPSPSFVNSHRINDWQVGLRSVFFFHFIVLLLRYHMHVIFSRQRHTGPCGKPVIV